MVHLFRLQVVSDYVLSICVWLFIFSLDIYNIIDSMCMKIIVILTVKIACDCIV